MDAVSTNCVDSGVLDKLTPWETWMLIITAWLLIVFGVLGWESHRLKRRERAWKIELEDQIRQREQ